jgi:hypothetical protein
MLQNYLLTTLCVRTMSSMGAQPHLVPRLCRGGSIPPFPHTSAWRRDYFNTSHDFIYVGPAAVPKNQYTLNKETFN